MPDAWLKRTVPRSPAQCDATRPSCCCRWAKQAAADVLKHLGPKDIHRVGAAMSSVGPLTVDAGLGHAFCTFLNEVKIHER